MKVSSGEALKKGGRHVFKGFTWHIQWIFHTGLGGSASSFKPSP